jgi:hypothetical protein
MAMPSTENFLERIENRLHVLQDHSFADLNELLQTTQTLFETLNLLMEKYKKIIKENNILEKEIIPDASKRENNPLINNQLILETQILAIITGIENKTLPLKKTSLYK